MPRWRRNSIFGQGPRQPLDRNQRARFLWLVRLHRRPGRLSSGHQKVAEALVRLLGGGGRLDPAHGFLATLARVDVATVKRALVRMRHLGLLWWQRRLVRDEATGWRCEQTSNAYALTPNPVSCAAQVARPAKHRSFKKEAHGVVRVAPEVRHANQLALNVIAARRMAALGLA